MNRQFSKWIRESSEVYAAPRIGWTPIGKQKKYKWVECFKCSKKIERLATLANRQFQCYDCRREQMRQYSIRDRAKKRHEKDPA